MTYPEAGSTGKRGGRGLYGVIQEEFHTGFIRLAQQLSGLLSREIPVLPVAQAFNPYRGFEVEILEPFKVPVDASKTLILAETSRVQKQLHTTLQGIIKGWQRPSPALSL